MTRPAAFLDRDGTIIVERHYLRDPAQVELERNAAEGLRAMSERGYALVVVSNQSGIGRGLVTPAELDAVNRRLADLLRERQVELSALYFCPHAPDAGCDCRKPASGMVLQAVREHGLDLSRSFMIGDKRADLELAARTGAAGILVETGYGAENVEWAVAHGHRICRDLLAASRMMPPIAA